MTLTGTLWTAVAAITDGLVFTEDGYGVCMGCFQIPLAPVQIGSIGYARGGRVMCLACYRGEAKT